MSTIKAGNLVNIGDEICGIEEFIGDQISTYTMEAKVYAATPGFINLDHRKRIISVDNIREGKRIIPRKNDTVICTATVVRPHMIGCLIFKINDRICESGIMAQLHVSNLSKKYVQKIDDAVQKTDIIRAQILGHNGIEWRIGTTVLNSGVIYSECRYCGCYMVRKNRDQVTCNFCGNTERKVAPDYGMINEKINF